MTNPKQQYSEPWDPLTHPYVVGVAPIHSKPPESKPYVRCKCGSESIEASYGTVWREYPNTVPGLLYRVHISCNQCDRRTVAESFALAVINWQSLGCIYEPNGKAQSKEDFYDDVSDYQDDELTDFGDVRNYTE